LLAGLVLGGRLMYLGGIFYLSIVLANYFLLMLIKRISLLPFIIWILHTILLNIIFAYDGFESAWKHAGTTTHQIDLSANFAWKYIYIWGMLRMISYSIDYHYALVTTNIPE
jgi:hypothetical protein